MPRYAVTICDVNTGEIEMRVASQAGDLPVANVICSHPWIRDIYKDTWIEKNLWAEDVDNCINNIHQNLNWSVLCVNLDDAIMNDLNGGDSSVYSSPQQQ
jgi:hypothetical protein